MPLKGFTETQGPQYMQQREKLRQFLVPLRHVLTQNPQFDVHIAYTGAEITNWEIDQIIIFDALYSLGAIGISVIYTAVHINSIVLSLAGMLQILLSIPAYSHSFFGKT